MNNSSANVIMDMYKVESLSRYFNSSEAIYENVSKVKPIDGYEDIFIHGDKTGFSFKDLNGNEIDYYTPWSLLKFLKKTQITMAETFVCLLARREQTAQ